MSKKSKRRVSKSNNSNKKDDETTIDLNSSAVKEQHAEDDYDSINGMDERMPELSSLLRGGNSEIREAPMPLYTRRRNISECSSNSINNHLPNDEEHQKTDTIKHNGNNSTKKPAKELLDFFESQFFLDKALPFAQVQSQFLKSISNILPLPSSSTINQTTEDQNALYRLCVSLKLYFACSANYQIAEIGHLRNNVQLLEEFNRSIQSTSMVHDLRSPGAASSTSETMNSDNIVNSTSLEDVPLSISSERAQSIQSLHSAMSDVGGSVDTPTSEQASVNYVELLDQQKAYMDTLRLRKEQLERAQKILLEQLKQVEDTKKEHTSHMSFGSGAENGTDNATTPNYESVDQVRGDMSLLAGRLSNITNFINDQNKLVNDIDAKTGGTLITEDMRADQDLLNQKVHDILAQRKDINSLVGEISQLNSEVSRRNGEPHADADESPSVTPSSSTETLKTIKNTNIGAESPSEERREPMPFTRVVPIEMEGKSNDLEVLVPEADSLINEKQSQIEAGRKYLEELKLTLKNIEAYEEEIKHKQAPTSSVLSSQQKRETSTNRDVSHSERESLTPTPFTSVQQKQKQLQHFDSKREHDKNDYEQSKKLFNELCKQVDSIAPNDARSEASATTTERLVGQRKRNESENAESVNLNNERVFESYREREESSQGEKKMFDELCKGKAAASSLWQNDSSLMSESSRTSYNSEDMPQRPPLSGRPPRGTTSSRNSVTSHDQEQQQQQNDSLIQNSNFTAFSHGTTSTQLGAAQSASMLDVSTLVPLLLTNFQSLMSTVTQLHNFVWQQQREIDQLKNQTNVMRQQIYGVNAHSTCDMPTISNNCGNLRSHSMPPLPPLQLPIPLQISTDGPMFNSSSCGHTTPNTPGPVPAPASAPILPTQATSSGATVIDTSCNFANAPSQQNFSWLRAQSEQPTMTDFPPNSNCNNCGSYPRNNGTCGYPQTHNQRQHHEQQSTTQQYQQQQHRYTYGNSNGAACQHFAGLNNEPIAHLNNAANLNASQIPHGNAQIPHQQPIFMNHHNNAIFAKNANLRSQNLLQQQHQQQHYNSTLLNNNSSNVVGVGGSSNLTHGSAGLMETSTLNNQVPPGNRANNYWDNFRSYSRQNLLSRNLLKNNEQQQIRTRPQIHARGYSNLASNSDMLQANVNNTNRLPEGYYNDFEDEDDGVGGDDCDFRMDLGDGPTFLEVAYRLYRRKFHMNDEGSFEPSRYDGAAYGQSQPRRNVGQIFADQSIQQQNQQQQQQQQHQQPLSQSAFKNREMRNSMTTNTQSADNHDSLASEMTTARSETNEPATGYAPRRFRSHLNENRQNSSNDFCLPLRNINVDKHNELAKSKVTAKRQCHMPDYNAIAAVVTAAASADAKDNALNLSTSNSELSINIDEEPPGNYKLTPKITNNNNKASVDINQSLDGVRDAKGAMCQPKPKIETPSVNSLKTHNADSSPITSKEQEPSNDYSLCYPSPSLSTSPSSEMIPLTKTEEQLDDDSGIQLLQQSESKKMLSNMNSKATSEVNQDLLWLSSSTVSYNGESASRFINQEESDQTANASLHSIENERIHYVDSNSVCKLKEEREEHSNIQYHQPHDPMLFTSLICKPPPGLPPLSFAKNNSKSLGTSFTTTPRSQSQSIDDGLISLNSLAVPECSPRNRENQSKGAIPKKTLSAKKYNNPGSDEIVMLNADNIAEDFLNDVIDHVEQSFRNCQQPKTDGETLAQFVVNGVRNLSSRYNVTNQVPNILSNKAAINDYLKYDSDDKEFDLEAYIVWLREKLRNLLLKNTRTQTKTSSGIDDEREEETTTTITEITKTHTVNNDDNDDDDNDDDDNDANLKDNKGHGPKKHSKGNKKSRQKSHRKMSKKH